MTILITGGCGFIGSAVVRHLIRETTHAVVNVDKLTYAGHPENVTEAAESDRYELQTVDITEAREVQSLFAQYEPGAVMHLAAESHVDRSIEGPADFIQTNVIGTYNLLDAALEHWRGLPEQKRSTFRFLHVSTDEVYGQLGDAGYFTESTPYDPRSPYSASKAGSDHLARAWQHTYGLPVIITNCSNNYGPYQYPEKLIPVVILRAINGEPIPVYGEGQNVRDWLFVEDHVTALMAVLKAGRVGETYVVGGEAERRNIDLVHKVCELLDEMRTPPGSHSSHAELITFVKDRPGHDYRYAIDPSKIKDELGWSQMVDFGEGLRRTVEWYLSNLEWCRTVRESA